MIIFENIFVTVTTLARKKLLQEGEICTKKTRSTFIFTTLPLATLPSVRKKNFVNWKWKKRQAEISTVRKFHPKTNTARLFLRFCVCDASMTDAICMKNSSSSAGGRSVYANATAGVVGCVCIFSRLEIKSVIGLPVDTA